MIPRNSFLFSTIVFTLIVSSLLISTIQNSDATIITSLAGDKDAVGVPGYSVGDAVPTGYAVPGPEDGSAFDQRRIGNAAWTHNYTLPPNETIISATLTILTYDIEDAGQGDGMGGAPFDDRLYLDGLEVVGAFDTFYTADGTSALPIIPNWAIFNLDSSFFSLIKDGTLSVSMVDLGSIGDHFWLDFSELKIETAPVPEPISMLLFGTGIVGIGGYVRKKFKQN
jgi:hypothetical protein